MLAFGLLEAKDCTSRDRVLIIGTHPDDEILCCSGIVNRALSRDMCVNVAILTSGEYWAPSKERALERQMESLNALSRLGLSDPNDVIFLGYPDGYLEKMYQSYQDKDSALITNKNVDSTYGGHGRGNADYHYTKFGTHGSYNYPTLLGDVTSIINDYDPTFIFVTATSMDSHGDHRVTHQVTMDALLQAKTTSLKAIYSTTIWNGNNNWPNSMDPFEAVKEIQPPSNYIKKAVRINVPLEMRSIDWDTNPKYLAMSEHVTQGGVECSFLLRFLHRDEFFWARSPRPGGKVPIADAGKDQRVCQGSTVKLSGKGSTLDSEDFTVEWKQTRGHAVELEEADTLTPHFKAPYFENEKYAEGIDLEFELTVTSYGGVKGFPAYVIVTVLPDDYKSYGENLARRANVKASSERNRFVQFAEAAVDGVVDGLIRVSPTEFGAKQNEWVTEGERAGAWIRLSWSKPVNISKVVLYDMISCSNQVTSGVLGFSDGSTIPVGPLDNKGSPNVFEFEPKVVSEVYFNITQVSPTTESAGLAEIMVYGLKPEPMCPSTRYTKANVVVGDVENNTVVEKPFDTVDVVVSKKSSRSSLLIGSCMLLFVVLTFMVLKNNRVSASIRRAFVNNSILPGPSVHEFKKN